MQTFFEFIQKKQLIIMRAPSGVGKSTLAKELGKNGTILSTDDFFLSDGGEYQFDGKKLGHAHQWNIQRTLEAMKKNVSPIVIDNTNTKLYEMKPYVQMAQTYGYEVEFVEPNWHANLKKSDGTWNPDFIKELQQKRVGKSLPPEMVDRMVARYDYQQGNQQDFVSKILSAKAPWENEKPRNPNKI